MQHMVGGLYTQNAQNFMGYPNMYANDPSPPPPSCWDQTPLGVKKFHFFNNPHICVFEMISATRGSFWDLYVGVPGTPAPLQPPPPPFRGPKCLGGVGVGGCTWASPMLDTWADHISRTPSSPLGNLCTACALRTTFRSYPLILRSSLAHSNATSKSQNRVHFHVLSSALRLRFRLLLMVHCLDFIVFSRLRLCPPWVLACACMGPYFAGSVAVGRFSQTNLTSGSTWHLTNT